MNTKKLIGTIIGVIMFTVLIAGATFAWLSFGTTIVENNVNSLQTMNFIVDYTNGSHITDMPMLDSTKIVPEQAKRMEVVAKKNVGSTDGHLSIKLTSETTNTLTTSGTVRWAICRGTPCTTNFANAVNSGKVTGGTMTLLNDAMLANGKACSDIDTKTKKVSADLTTNTVCDAVAAAGGSSATTNMIGNGNTTDSITYYIYFWFDGATISNSHKEQTYAGYIHAGATQLEN